MACLVALTVTVWCSGLTFCLYLQALGSESRLTDGGANSSALYLIAVSRFSAQAQ